MSGSLRIVFAMTLGAAVLAAAPEAPAQTAGSPTAAAVQNVTRGPSGLPLPRFVSLKSGRVNSRVGPGVNYAVDWLYLKPGLPMEIIQEYDNWRRVRDADGAEGWINQSLLSGRRTAIIAPWQKGKSVQLNLLKSPQAGAGAVAMLEPGVIGSIESCDGDWCRISVSGHSGWLEQTFVWGAYPGEQVKQ
ncbi:MAG: SH3 domain-containing protein [Rhizobiaceae bacterium]